MKYSQTIDVIFVHPKHRNYVIWHDDCFYQLARMELTQASWDRRAVYTGLLDEIFVAKESCEGVGSAGVSGLAIATLPAELHGVTASKFLAWWVVNRYQFWKNHTAHLVVQETSHQTPTAEQTTKVPLTSMQTSLATTGTNHQISSPTPPKHTSATPHHPPIEELSGEDIFDALFDDLVEEINHVK